MPRTSPTTPSASKQQAATRAASAALSRATAEQETRRRLLAAAGEAFAEAGFKGATIRDICKRAGANVAAVNYHFRDKEELYHCVFEEAACIAHEHFKTAAPASESLAPRERLNAFIRLYLQRLLSPGRPAWHGKLMAREMMEPTAVLDRIVERAIRPNAQLLGEIVTAISGVPRSDPNHWFMAASVVAQCLFYMHAKPVIHRLRPDIAYDESLVDQLAEHVTAFSYAAITGYKASRAESPRKRSSGGPGNGAAK